MLWLVCYDVADDRRRLRLAKRIEQSCHTKTQNGYAILCF
jgi:CRISPR-associated endonuclease Cas2